MTIRRAPRRERFTQIDNCTIEDQRLSFKALGVLTYILSKPDNWEAHREQLAKAHADGEKAVRHALKELTTLGYIRREPRRDPKSGRMQGWVSTVHETAGQPERAKTGHAVSGPDGEAAKPQVTPKGPKPAMPVIGLVENRPGRKQATLVSTENTNTENTTTTSPNGDNEAVKVKGAQPDPLRGFPEFWDRYPRRDGKKLYRQKAEQQWKALSLEDRRAAWRGAGHYAAACEQGLTRAKDALRWLRDRCWEDWQTPAKADVKREKRDGQVASWSPASAPTGRQFGGSLA